MRIKIKNIIVYTLLLVLSLLKVYSQDSNGWYYKKAKKESFGKSYTFYELSYYRDSILELRQTFKSSTIIQDKISKATFWSQGTNRPKSIIYLWRPFNGQIYLSLLKFDADSVYHFYEDGISIHSIVYNEELKYSDKEYKLGERYFFDFPSPRPDTLPAFFEKVKEGCPYTPCAVISTGEGDKEQGEGSGK